MTLEEERKDEVREEADADKKDVSAKKRRLSWRSVLSWIGAIPWSAIGGWLGRMLRKKWVAAVSFVLCVVIFLCIAALIISGAVCDKTEKRVLSIEEFSAQALPADCILVLGCKVMDDGTPSDRLYDRVRMAAELYHLGLGKKILMSGDSEREDYDEVGTMKQAAVEMGVPAEVIETDGMGLSTYDSIARIANQYRGKRLLIVTQEYHLYRALYIAEKFDLEAWGVSADTHVYQNYVWHQIREVLARCKAVVYAEKKPIPAGMES